MMSRRKFSKELKLEAVRRLGSGQTVAEVARAVEGNRPANLSITRKFGCIEPQLDVGESGEPTPHDRITRRRITSASEIAAKSGQLGDVEGQRLAYGAICGANRNKMIQQLALGF